MKKLITALTLSACLLPFMPHVSWAQRNDHDHDHWHGDINHFHDHDFDRWREGGWYHGRHEGRDGWFWVIGDSYYYYPAPIYPYPDPYIPPTIVATPTPTPGAYWYYCRNPEGYYPYVSECFHHWRRVPATVTTVTTAPNVVVQPAPTVVQQAPTIIQQGAPQTPPTLSVPGSETREQDMHQLNVFAGEFSEIDPGPHAFSKLRELRKRVEAYHQALYQRNYNAADVLKNTEDLEKRIDAEKERMNKKYGSHPESAPPSEAPDSIQPPTPPAGLPPAPPPE